MNKNQKGVIHFVLILGIALIALSFIGFNLYKNGDIFNTPSQGTSYTPKTSDDTTADWNTYRNKKHGFIFKYPQDWVQKQTYGEKSEEWLIIFGLHKGKDNIITLTEPGNVELREFANRQNLSFKEAIIDELSSTSPVPFDPDERKRIIINNLDDMEETIIQNHNVLIDETKAYVFINPEVISLRIQTPSDRAHKILFDQILSTFKFID